MKVGDSMKLKGTMLANDIRHKPRLLGAMRALRVGYPNIARQHGMALIFLGLASKLHGVSGYVLTPDGRSIVDQLDHAP